MRLRWWGVALATLALGCVVVTAAMRRARARARALEETVDHAGEESFPASDPPWWNPGAAMPVDSPES
jgi:hypothetical protein